MTSHHARTVLTLLTLALPACGTDDATTDTDSSDTTASPATTGTADTTGSAGTTSTGTTDDATTTTGDTPTTGTTGTTDTTTASTTDDTTGVVADCGFDSSLEFTRDALTWQLESEDGSACVWLERRNDSEPDIIYKAVPYTLLEWKSGHAGVLAHVTDAAKLTWESTHHNWMDVATATDGTVVYRLEDEYPLEPVDENFVDHFAFSAHDAVTDELLWGPITLYPHKP